MREFNSLPERIKQKIRFTESGCWEWTACVDTPGYGRIYWYGKLEEAHRVVYELLVEPIPEGLVVDHMCHTEACGKRGKECLHRRCQNPAHFRIVTQGDNALRSDSPPALNALKTACDNGHEYTSETMVIDDGTRRCKICRRDADKRRRPRGVPRKDRERKGLREFNPRGATPERVARNAEILRLRDAGLSQSAIAAEMGLSQGCVSAVCWRASRAA